MCKTLGTNGAFVPTGVGAGRHTRGRGCSPRRTTCCRLNRYHSVGFLVERATCPFRWATSPPVMLPEVPRKTESCCHARLGGKVPPSTARLAVPPISAEYLRLSRPGRWRPCANRCLTRSWPEAAGGQARPITIPSSPHRAPRKAAAWSRQIRLPCSRCERSCL